MRRTLTLALCLFLCLGAFAGCQPPAAPAVETPATPPPASDRAVAPSAPAALYTPGVYTGVGTGMGGELTVEVNLSESEILSVTVTKQNETPLLGCGLETAPVEWLPLQIVAHQSLGLDAVTGATISSAAVMTAVKDAITQAGGDAAALAAKKATAEGQDEEYQADVVVAGAGIAGIMAAVRAKEAGAEVIVVEKAGSLTCSSNRCGGLFMAAGTKYIDETPDQLYDYLMEIGKNQLDPEKIRGFVTSSNDILEYLISLGTVIENVQNVKDKVIEHPVVFMAAAENPDGQVDLKPYTTSVGVYYMMPLYKEAERLGVKFLFNTPMTEILMDNDAAVGVKCQRNDGGVTTVHAKSVILATGGFAANKDMINANATIVDGKWASWAANTCTGDGMRLAEAVGAKVAYDKDGIMLSPLCSRFTSSYAESLMVTPTGERFTREYDYPDSAVADLHALGYSIAYQIVDDKYPNDDIQAAIASGTLVSGATPEALAKELGMDPAVLSATIARYNELCGKGVDEDYDKLPEYMIPLGKDGATLYAMEHTPSVTETFGGVYTDDSFRALNTNDQVIPGLYAAGACAFTDVIGGEYPSCGFAMGMGAYMGQTAGAAAVADMKG